VTFRNAVVPWLGGGLLVLGYAAVNWLHSKSVKHVARGSVAPASARRADDERAAEVLSSQLEHPPDERGLDLESERLPANPNAPARDALGALFLGRASEALSGVHFGADWPSSPR
jgi:hypothetical protein